MRHAAWQRSSAQQSHRVRHNYQHRDFVNEHSHGHRCSGKQHTCDQQEHRGERDYNVLDQDSPCAARKVNEFNQAAEVIGHERNIGGLNRNSRTAAAHRNPQVSRG